MGLPLQGPRIAFLMVQRQHSALEYIPSSHKVSSVRSGWLPHPHCVIGFQHTLCLAGEENTDDPWRLPSLCFVPYLLDINRHMEMEWSVRQPSSLGLPATHQLGPARNVSFTLPIWSCSHVTSTTPPSLTSGHLLSCVVIHLMDN